MPVSKQPTPNNLEGSRHRIDLTGYVANNHNNPNGADSPELRDNNRLNV